MGAHLKGEQRGTPPMADPKDTQKDAVAEVKDESRESAQGSSAVAKTGGLIPFDQALPPNLFVLPVGGPVTYPTLLSPLLVSHPKHIAMIEEAINRQRMIGLILTREGEVREDTKP